MKTWKEFQVVQPLASKVLMNSIEKNRISHAYLIQGGRGVGKRQLALLLAKVLFCRNIQGIEPCHTCRNCRRIESGNHPDVHWIDPDGQTIRIEQIRRLQEEFIYTGLESKQKVYIISNAERLTLNAANRILKFLEEPNQQTTALLLTENIQSIISTIRSRCQIIDLQPLNPLQFQQQLIEHNISKEEAVFLSSITNDLQEALSLTEGEWFRQARNIVLKLIDTYLMNSSDVFLFIHNHWMTHFKERSQLEQGLDLLLIAFKDVLYYHIGNHQSMLIFSLDDDTLKKAASVLSEQRLIVILNLILEAKQKLKQNVHPTLVMEQLALHI